MILAIEWLVINTVDVLLNVLKVKISFLDAVPTPLCPLISWSVEGRNTFRFSHHFFFTGPKIWREVGLSDFPKHYLSKILARIFFFGVGVIDRPDDGSVTNKIIKSIHLFSCVENFTSKWAVVFQSVFLPQRLFPQPLPQLWKYIKHLFPFCPLFLDVQNGSIGDLVPW